MTGAPKVIVLSGPLAMEKPENQYGTSVRYIRADAPELVELVIAASRMADAVEHRLVNSSDVAAYDYALAQWEALTK